MKEEEIEILGLKKLAEGKSYKQIKEEINNIDSFGKKIKVDKKVIEKQYKEIKKLKEQLEKQKKKIFNLKLKLDTKEPDKEKKNINLNDIKKIILLIRSENGLNKKDIYEILYFNNKKIDTILSFLKRNKLIEEKIISGTKYYK